MLEFLRTPQKSPRKKPKQGGGLQPESWSSLIRSSEWRDEMEKIKKNAKSGHKLENYGEDGWYDGDFLFGERHGKGILVFHGWKYDGEWKHDKMEGKGKKIEEDGATYNGDWKAGREHGYGRLTNADETVSYAGEWRCGKRYGHGKQIWDHGDSYDGEWYEGKFHNRGTYYYKSGDKYCGLWKNGVNEGEGTMFFADGSQSRRFHSNGVLMSVQDFDLTLGKYGPVVRREAMQKHTNPPSRIAEEKEKSREALHNKFSPDAPQTAPAASK